MSEIKAPSEKQVALAEKLAEKKGVSAPAGYDTDVSICRAFIDQMVAPSEKQLNFARTIAEEKGIDIPEDALKDGMKLSRFIDEHRSAGKK